jgi:hypothetical protein
VSDFWPPSGGNWEGGTVANGRRFYHEPHVGWRDAGPVGASPFYAPPAGPSPSSARPEPDRLVLGRIYRDPRTLSRRARLARWLHERRHGVVAWTAVTVVLGYAAVFVLFFDRVLPTLRDGLALAGAGGVLVLLLLSVVLWARRHE